MTTDRNRADKSAEATASEGAGTTSAPVAFNYAALHRFAMENRVDYNALARLVRESVLAPPASIPAAKVQALVDELRAEIKPYRNFPTPTDKVRKQCTDRLAKLVRDYAPEVSQKPPSLRNPE